MNDKFPTIDFVIIEDDDNIYLVTIINKHFKTTNRCDDIVEAEERIAKKLASYGDLLVKYTIKYE